MLEQFFEEVIEAVVRGEPVRLRSFGKFNVRSKRERVGRNGGDDLPNATIIVGAPHSAAPPFLILTPAPPPFSATNSTAAALAWMRYAEAGRA